MSRPSGLFIIMDSPTSHAFRHATRRERTRDITTANYIDSDHPRRLFHAIYISLVRVALDPSDGDRRKYPIQRWLSIRRTVKLAISTAMKGCANGTSLLGYGPSYAAKQR